MEEHIPELTLAALALVFAALSAGTALRINVVHYQTRTLVPPAGFGPFHAASGIRDASTAAAVGLPTLVFALLLARRGLPGIYRAPLWVAAALSMAPWVVTPAVFLPLQASIGELGPTPELVFRLVALDLFLRASPVVFQLCIYLWALVRSLGVLGAGERAPREENAAAQTMMYGSDLGGAKGGWIGGSEQECWFATSL